MQRVDTLAIRTLGVAAGEPLSPLPLPLHDGLALPTAAPAVVATPPAASVRPLGPVMRAPVDLEVIIPAYNESARLPRTLSVLVAFLADQRWSSRIVVVDNGSADDTAAAVGRLPDVAVETVVIGCSQAGKGAAVHRGLRTSRARFVGFTDADLSTPPETLLPAIAVLEQGAAAAIASRRAPGAHLAVPQPLVRRVGGSVFRAVSRPLVPGVHDTQCGFKFFNRAAVHSALWRSRSTGFAFDIEILRHIHNDGGQIVEIPVTWTDFPGSTLRPLRDGLTAFTTVAKLRRDLAGARGRPVGPHQLRAGPARVVPSADAASR